MNEFMIVIPFEKIKENLGLQLFFLSQWAKLATCILLRIDIDLIDWDTEGWTPFVFRYGEEVVEPDLT